MHDAVRDYCAKHASDVAGHGLDIGGRDLNGHPRDLWPSIDWTVIDLLPGEGVDIVADVTRWDPDRTYDVVLCTEVLEHAKRWPYIITTAYRALKPGGLLVVTCAGPGRPPHSGIEATAIQPGEYYQNVQAAAVGYVMERVGFDQVEAHELGFDTQASARRP